MTTPTNTEAVDWKKRIFEIYKNSCGDGLRSAHFESIGISQIAQEIRQTHLDLLREVHNQEIERAVTIAKSYSINKKVGDRPNVVVPEKLYRELLELNQQMDEVENKSSHIITRVEGGRDD